MNVEMDSDESRKENVICPLSSEMNDTHTKNCEPAIKAECSTKNIGRKNYTTSSAGY